MRQGRSTTALRARSRTSTATTESGTTPARSARSHSGRAAEARAARRGSSPSLALLRVGDPQIQRLHRVRWAEIARELSVEARPRKMELAVALGDDGPELLERRAVADRAVADAEGSGRHVELARG